MRLRCLAAALAMAMTGHGAAAECDFQTGRHIEALSDINAIRSIDVRVRNHRKWVRNGLAILTSRTQNIPADLKRNFKARVAIAYPFGTCVFDARVRQNGDWRDHIRFRGSHIERSLDVRLKTGNLAGVVRFKLFLPETRLSLNELFATEVMRDLGFITPRTRVVPVMQHGRRAMMIFQEKPAKEMLEFHKRREGPLLEGDEALIWDWRLHSPDASQVVEAFSLARVTNDRWSARGVASAGMSAAALTKLQRVYAAVAFSPDRTLSLPLFRFENRRPGAFEAVLLAMNGRHGVIPHNRQFYWNALADEFEPIYYDGNALLSRYELDRETPEDLNRFAHLFAPDLVKNLRRRVAAMDADQLAQRISQLALTSVDPANVAKMLGNMDLNFASLLRLSQSPKPALSGAPPSGIGPDILRRASEVFPDVRVSRLIGFDGGGGAIVETCDVSACARRSETLTALSDRLAGGGLRHDGPKDFFVGAAPGEAAKRHDIQALGLTIRHAPGGRVDWDATRRQITLSQGKPGDWFLVNAADLDDVAIRFVPADGAAAQTGQRFNAFGVTGCLTLFNTRFSGASITARGGGCEDVVNIVGGAGALTAITVQDAPFDAVDLDFADLDIDRLDIRDAGNDCLDVSSGRYRVKAVEAAGCGDKGISVGEASHMRVERFSADRAAIGVSSKDSSIVTIADADIRTAPICFEAFRKKQEFGGASLRFGRLACEGGSTVDDNSVVEIGSGRM